MIRVFPQRTKWTPVDDLVFIGDPPLFRPAEMPVKISVIFTWDIDEGERLGRSWRRFYKNVEVGGPAFSDPAKGDFVPGRFVKNGFVFTSRGCLRRCPWCFVPEREGKIRELTICDGYHVADNNFLATSEKHQNAVFAMLQKQREPAEFGGGLDCRLLKKRHVDEFKKIRIKYLWLAADTVKSEYNLQKAADLLADFSIEKKRCYVLVGFNGETQADAESRLIRIYEMGILPMAMLFRGKDGKKYNPEWSRFLKIWSRPAVFRTLY